MKKDRTIHVDYLARVEGEGSLLVEIKDDTVCDVKFKVFEPPRFFEAFLRGRKYTEAPDITARICGICPVAYQMSAVHAMEKAFGVTVEGPLRDLRRLIYCGEWIESHVLHACMLHLPDFLGYDDVIQMAQDHPESVRMALELKKTGNEIVTAVGGREIHPVNVRVGGFYRVPRKRELTPLRERLERGIETAQALLRLFAKLPYPHLERDYRFVSLSHPVEYPLNEGRLVSNTGLEVPVEEYRKHFSEQQVMHSNALHSVMDDLGAYLTGPMARFNLNFERLTDQAREASLSALEWPCRNPFKSIMVRAVETLYACQEALRIVVQYEEPDDPAVDFEPAAGIGHGCTEAPRGILYHGYELDAQGNIVDARIVPPTAQNQKTIEEDLRDFVPLNLGLSDTELTWRCEQLIRNYDPCISCATHFLKLEIHRV